MSPNRYVSVFYESLKVSSTSEMTEQTSSSVHDKHKTQEGGDVLDGAHIRPTALSLWGCLFGTDTKRSLQ